MSHTPGPWMFGKASSKEVYSRESGDSIARLTQRVKAMDGEVDANGVLIAAAPALLAACQEVNRLANEKGEQSGFALQAQRILQAAIARATGGEA